MKTASRTIKVRDAEQLIAYPLKIISSVHKRRLHIVRDLQLVTLQ